MVLKMNETILKMNTMILKMNETILKMNTMVLKMNENIFKMNENIFKMNENILKMNTMILKMNENILKMNTMILKMNETILKMNTMVLKMNETILKKVWEPFMNSSQNLQKNIEFKFYTFSKTHTSIGFHRLLTHCHKPKFLLKKMLIKTEMIVYNYKIFVLQLHLKIKHYTI